MNNRLIHCKVYWCIFPAFSRMWVLLEQLKVSSPIKSEENIKHDSKKKREEQEERISSKH